jgi:nucleotide-binding universal stress UspA family protein
MSTKSIVVGLDGTAPSAAALSWAAEEGRERGLPLRIVHVWELPSADEFLGVDTTAVSDEKARVEARSWALQALDVDELPPEYEQVVRRGAPGPALVAEAEGQALLVVGTGVHRGLRRLIEGSVSHYCVAHAPVPVVSVPAVQVTLPKSQAEKTARGPQPVGPLF